MKENQSFRPQGRCPEQDCALGMQGAGWGLRNLSCCGPGSAVVQVC
jgi:hypothetical protein